MGWTGPRPAAQVSRPGRQLRIDLAGQLAEPVSEPFRVPAGQQAKRLDVIGAPSRIRTCAHGSGEFADLTL